MKEKFSGLAVIIQCRLSSSRLPGKAIKLLGGKTVLEWTLNSMKKVNASRYFVATDENSYDSLKPICDKCGWELFKGPLEDVLERYCLLINEIKCKTVLRATADNPFLFYEAAQLLVEEFEKQSKNSKCDYMTWTGLPHGSGVEIFSAESLLKAKPLTNDPYDHEHVGPALYNHKNNFVSLFYKAPSRFYYPDYRTTIDTPSDFRRALAVVNKLSNGVTDSEPYTTEQIVSAITDSFVHDTVLFVPSLNKGQGTGHLRRCLKACDEACGFIYVPEDSTLTETQKIISEYMSEHPSFREFQIVKKFPEPKEFALIVLDLFSTDLKLAERFVELSPVVALDEGSDNTRFFDYLIDIIPSFLSRTSNKTAPYFIETSENKKENWDKTIKDVLVCFGGEDPAGFTIPVSAFFNEGGFSVTSVISNEKLASDNIDVQSYTNIRFVENIPNLKDGIYKYDLVVTHYGLTAFEAAEAGCAVLLFPTTKVHENLSKKYGFSNISLSELKTSNPKEKFNDASKFLVPGKLSSGEGSLGKFIKKLSHGKRYMCPVCQIQGQNRNEIIARTETKTYRRCRNCGITYISYSFCETPVKYEKSYFDEQYKAQYGKTYLEDFDSIKKNCMNRMLELNSIVNLKSQTKPSVLDIGCAYGPFLQAASEDGWLPFGTDISKDAVDYVKNKLLIPSVVSSFPEFDAVEEFGITEFDAVTMWFVIEHFENLKAVLERVSTLIKIGGIFSFSTPSGSGVSAKYNTQSFYESSPQDHYTIWNPYEAEKILKLFGFKIVKIKSTGHHPERFPIIKKSRCRKNSLLFKLYGIISRVFKLGDTCEIYCRKIK